MALKNKLKKQVKKSGFVPFTKNSNPFTKTDNSVKAPMQDKKQKGC